VGIPVSGYDVQREEGITDLDTGVDFREIVNLAFMKPVNSQIKFWQKPVVRRTPFHDIDLSSYAMVSNLHFKPQFAECIALA